MEAKRVHEALRSEWGRLFHNWEKVQPDEKGWADVGEGPAKFIRATGKLFWKGIKILGQCIKEAPEFATRKRRKQAQKNQTKS